MDVVRINFYEYFKVQQVINYFQTQIELLDSDFLSNFVNVELHIFLQQ